MASENNPYARKVPEREKEPHERRLTQADNVPGAPNPQFVPKHASGQEVMSGLSGRDGSPLTVGQAQATLNNAGLAAVQLKQPDAVVTRNINGREVEWPANTPTV